MFKRTQHNTALLSAGCLQVCTAQYFVWFFSLLPLILPRLSWPPPRGLVLAMAFWVVLQLHWLLWGYLLEFQVRSMQ